ncbi:sugar transferase [Geobacillus stearothermophilus]|nr:sugar transferase [Geobacillus stearothermophilus]
MSFVGPRPEVPRYTKLYNEEQKKVLTVKPGITDYASIKYRSENELLAKSDNPEKTYIEEIMPDKLKLNLKYIKEQSLWLDIKIIIMTIYKVIK